MAKKKQDAKSKRVKVSVPADLVDAIEAAGGDIEDTIERLLRGALGEPTADKAGAKSRIAGFLQDIAGPYVPQLEAIAKEVASKVAKDVATAATAAALATFTAKAAADAKPVDAKPKPRAPRKPAPKGQQS